MYKVFLLSWPLSGGKRVFVNGLNNNRWKSKLCEGNSSVVKIHFRRPKPDQFQKMQLQNATPLGIEPASSGLLDQCSTTELQKPLSTTQARVQYIYIY